MNRQNPEFRKIKNKRNLTLFWLGIAALITGFINAFTNNIGLPITMVRLLMPLVAIAIIYYWIIYDARLRNYRIPKYVKYIIILFGIIGVPIYFWQTRNFFQFCLNIGGFWLFIYYLLIYYVGIVVTTFGLSSLGYYLKR